MNINKEKLYANFMNITNIANLNILICYKKLLNKKGILYNFGFYIILFVIILHISFIFTFYLKEITKIRIIIKDISFGIENFELIHKKGKSKKVKKKKKLPMITKEKDESIINDVNNIDNEKIENLNDDKKLSLKIVDNKTNKKTIDSKGNSKTKRNKSIKIIISNNNTMENGNKIKLKKKKGKRKIKVSKIDNSNSALELNSSIGDKQKIIEKVKKIMEYTDEEKNILSYELVKEYDNRSYCEYYISLLKTKHNFIFSFIFNKDYNSKIIKRDIFFTSFAIYYSVNALFFDDDTMHKIYITNGSFNLEYQLPKIIYSSIISLVLNSILKLLALSNDVIIKFKQNKSNDNLNERKNDLENKLRIKFIVYFIVSCIFLLFFWYYISMFGAIYRNTQIHLIKDTIISFALSLIYPFGLYLLPCLFRIPSISNPKQNRKCLYNFSKILQML